MNTIKVYGGDTIEDTSGNVGRIWRSAFSIRYGGATYTIATEDGRDIEVGESEVQRIVAYGKHDYRPGAQRGYCGRCSVQKRNHA